MEQAIFKDNNEIDPYVRKQKLLFHLLDNATERLRSLITEVEAPKYLKEDMLDNLDDLNEFWVKLLNLFRESVPQEKIYIHQGLITDTCDYLKKYK